MRGIGYASNWETVPVVRIGNLTSSALTLSTGAPQGCIITPLLYTDVLFFSLPLNIATIKN